MKIGILGSGVVGHTLGAGFVRYGHTVKMGSRTAQSPEAHAWVAQTPGTSAGTFADAAQFGEIAVLAVQGRIADKVVELAGPDNLAGKPLIDATNPLAEGPPVDGVLPYFTGPNESLAEKIQSLAPRAHVVKAFNSVGSGEMINPQFAQGPPTMFFCGNDAGAKARVSEIIRQLGWEPFDCGTIRAARALEPLCMLWCLPGFREQHWTHAFKLLRR